MRVAHFVRLLLIAGVLAAAGCNRAPATKAPTTPGLSPQVIAARGTLAESEQATIEIFRAVSPSVVLVIASTPGRGCGVGCCWPAWECALKDVPFEMAVIGG